MSDILKYEVYNKASFVVHGHKDTYNTLLKRIGGRWNTRLSKCPPGWTVPRENEKLLIKLVDAVHNKSLEGGDKFGDMVKHAKPKNTQHKYHRSTSPSDPIPNPTPHLKKSVPLAVVRDFDEPENDLDKIFDEKLNPEIETYYKNFSKYVKTPEYSVNSSDSDDHSGHSLQPQSDEKISPLPPSNRHREETPPRRRHRDETPPRRRHRDETPPRRRHRDETPPPRRHRDETPPRRRHREETPPPRRHRDETRRHRDEPYKEAYKVAARDVLDSGDRHQSRYLESPVSSRRHHRRRNDMDDEMVQLKRRLAELESRRY